MKTKNSTIHATPYDRYDQIRVLVERAMPPIIDDDRASALFQLLALVADEESPQAREDLVSAIADGVFRQSDALGFASEEYFDRLVKQPPSKERIDYLTAI